MPNFTRMLSSKFFKIWNIQIQGLFKDFQGLSRTYSVFKDFQAPWIFSPNSRTFKDFSRTLWTLIIAGCTSFCEKEMDKDDTQSDTQSDMVLRNYHGIVSEASVVVESVVKELAAGDCLWQTHISCYSTGSLLLQLTATLPIIMTQAEHQPLQTERTARMPGM